MAKDLYDVLGVPKNASQDDIKKAYRKLAHQHHPDKQGGDASRFKEINEAYQVLSDSDKRKRYDQFGSAGEQFSGFGGANSGSQDFHFGGVSFEDIFDMFGGGFGGQTQSQRPRGNDLVVSLDMDLKDVAHSFEEQIELKGYFECNLCHGSGAEDGKTQQCVTCKGSGQVRESSRSLFGNFVRVTICRECNGVGTIPVKKCKQCGGSGHEKTKKTLSIQIPAGIHDGETLVIRGRGELASRGGEPGDLYIRIRVKNDPRFVRDRNNIIYNLHVGFVDAVLGKEFEVPTLEGNTTTKVPAGSTHGAELRMKGKGLAGGDEIIQIFIDIPKKISNKAKKMLEDLAKEL